MSRGGRGGRGGKRGPDMSWDDEETTEPTPNARIPGPLFPSHSLPTPKPLTPSEKDAVTTQIRIRDRFRRGPLHATVDPTLTQSRPDIVTNSNKDQTPSKPNPRAGFDPFNDQEKYTTRYHHKRRFVPDLGERGGYTLRLFPLELWGVLDPKRRMAEWDSLTDDQKARVTSGPARTKKRKRDHAQPIRYDDEGDETRNPRGSGSEATDGSDDEDATSRRRRRTKPRNKDDDAPTKTKQKKGLDAEDDYPDVDQQDEDGEGGDPEDEPRDSEFETDEGEDDGMDDYNAEQYFDDGADEMDGGGDDDDGGGGGYF